MLTTKTKFHIKSNINSLLPREEIANKTFS